jgi:hypothetical protein
MLCALGTRSNQGCSAILELFCETPQDECRTNADCPSNPLSYCQVSDAGRICVKYGPSVCGRPFLVEGSARLANVEPTNTWLAANGAAPDCSLLNTEQRWQLAQVWAELGLMEHASIAAFARFTLQLLSVGAPAELVEQSQRALADELLHAQICFGLASAYAGEPIGPGPLPTEHALDLSSLEDIAALTLHEGCVGETIAALEASEALARATEPAVRAALTRIEADERRHAELGWRFVTWAVRAGGASVQRRIQRELAGILSQPVSVDGAERVSFEAAAHGVLSASQRTELRAAALRDVVQPCARALLPAEPSSVTASAAA